MSVELKIKAKHLALEPAIIRQEEQKIKRQLAWHLDQVDGEKVVQWRWHNSEDPIKVSALKLRSKLNSLIYHRMDRSHNGLRTEARATALARAFIDGTKYSKVEQSRKPENEWAFRNIVVPRIAKMVMKYGNNRLSEEKILSLVQAWIKTT